MKKYADYIKRIEIHALWGRKNIEWNLRPDVNILSGINGIGKSTILNQSVYSLEIPETGEVVNTGETRVKFVFSPTDANSVRFDVIRSFDRLLLHGW